MKSKVISKKQYAYDQIKEAIISNKLKSGEPISERAICEDLGMSRTPVREALVELAKDGMLSSDQGRGFFVAKIKFEDMAEIYDIRDVLECLAVRLTTERATEKEILELETIYKAGKKALEENDTETFMQIDMNFHLAIASLSRNKRLLDMLISIYSPITMMAAMTRDDKEVQDLAVSSHEDIMKAILEKDPKAASEAMHRHIERIRSNHIKKYYLFPST